MSEGFPPDTGVHSGCQDVSIDSREINRTRRWKRLRVALAVLALCVAAVLAAAAFMQARGSTRALVRPPPSHLEAAQRCHDDGGVSMWRAFHREFVRCDYPDGRSVNAAFDFTKPGP